MRVRASADGEATLKEVMQEIEALREGQQREQRDVPRRLTKEQRTEANRRLISEGQRICRTCEARLPLDEFHAIHDRRSDGLYYASDCKACTRLKLRRGSP